MLDHSFINTFVPAANQDDLFCLRQPQRFGLIERPAARAEHHDFGPVVLTDSLDGAENRFGLENHSFAAAKRPVVYSTMPVRGEFSEVVDSRFDEPIFPAPTDHAEIEGPLEEFRKDGDYVESNHLFNSRRPSGKSTSIRR